MPYIKDENNRREELRVGIPANVAGELNFQIFAHVKYDKFDRKTVEIYVKNFLGENPNYQRYNDMTGALARCCVEIERRFENKEEEINQIVEICMSYDEEIAQYEDKKIKENGDV